MFWRDCFFFLFYVLHFGGFPGVNGGISSGLNVDAEACRTRWKLISSVKSCVGKRGKVSCFNSHCKERLALCNSSHMSSSLSCQSTLVVCLADRRRKEKEKEKGGGVCPQCLSVASKIGFRSVIIMIVTLSGIHFLFVWFGLWKNQGQL